MAALTTTHHPSAPLQRTVTQLQQEEQYDDDVYIEPVIDSGEGATLRLVDGSGGRRKLKPSQADNGLELSATTSNIINLAALERDSPVLREVLAPIRSHTEFTKLFVATAPVKVRRPLSRGMARHDEPLREYDVVEEVQYTATAAEMAETAFAAYFMVWITLFLVAKKNGKGRLIGDARPINELQRNPEAMGLPRIHDVIRQVLTYDVADKTDGVSYFYQFELAEDIRPYFKTRLAGQRGQVLERMFKRLPMGWKFSPRIAQQTSNFLLRGVGVAWLDDFIIGGASREEFEANRATFLERLKNPDADTCLRAITSPHGTTFMKVFDDGSVRCSARVHGGSNACRNKSSPQSPWRPLNCNHKMNSVLRVLDTFVHTD